MLRWHPEIKHLVMGSGDCASRCEHVHGIAKERPTRGVNKQRESPFESTNLFRQLIDALVRVDGLHLDFDEIV